LLCLETKKTRLRRVLLPEVVGGSARVLRVDGWTKRYNIAVFPVGPFVVAIYLAAYALAGMAIGALSGWLFSLGAKCGRQGIVRDAFLGSFGFLAGFFACIFMPFPRNTIVESLPGGGTVATTMHTYQHPERAAVAVAVLLPLLHELYRLKRGPNKPA
jgi:hypothetical protein